MAQLELRSVHPVEPKEITPIGAWILTRLMVVMAGILSILPFAVNFSK